MEHCLQPDGKTLAAGGCHGALVANACREGRVVMWTLEGRAFRGGSRALSPHEGNVLAIAFTGEGKTLAAGDDQGSIALWDLDGDQSLARLQGHQGMIWSLCFSADAKVLASGNYNNTVTLWNWAEGTVAAGALAGHTGAVTSISCHPRSPLLASASQDGTVIVWDASSGGRPIESKLIERKGRVSAVAMRRNRRTAALGICERLDDLGTCVASRIAVQDVSGDEAGETMLTGIEGEVWGIALDSRDALRMVLTCRDLDPEVGCKANGLVVIDVAGRQAASRALFRHRPQRGAERRRHDRGPGELPGTRHGRYVQARAGPGVEGRDGRIDGQAAGRSPGECVDPRIQPRRPDAGRGNVRRIGRQ